MGAEKAQLVSSGCETVVNAFKEMCKVIVTVPDTQVHENV
jgi:hypothetical protein